MPTPEEPLPPARAFRPPVLPENINKTRDKGSFHGGAVRVYTLIPAAAAIISSVVAGERTVGVDACQRDPAFMTLIRAGEARVAAGKIGRRCGENKSSRATACAQNYLLQRGSGSDTTIL